jgi:small subunit ribosomal protein S20
MPILQNAKKALRATARKTEYNQQVKSRAKTMMDKVRKEPTKENLSSSYQAIDKATKRKVFHANKAARLKSQLARLVK